MADHAAEAAATQSIYTQYVLVLAATGPSPWRSSRRHRTLAAVVSYVVALAITFVLAFIVDAPRRRSAAKDFVASLKLTDHSSGGLIAESSAPALPGRDRQLLALIYTCYIRSPRRAGSEEMRRTRPSATRSSS
jgi:hypothetical protein